MPATMAVTEPAAAAADSPARWCSMSADHSARQNSTAMPAVITTQQIQYRRDSRPGGPPSSGAVAGTGWATGDTRRPTTAITATAGSTSSRAERQPAPVATATPTTSGAAAPTAAATALASVIAAGPVSPCTAESTVELQVTTKEPPKEHAKRPEQCQGGSGVNVVSMTMPPQSSTRPAQIIAVRPNRGRAAQRTAR